MTPPEPVTVHVAQRGLWEPYSKGYRNCFSALAKWLDVRAMTLSAYPAATFIAARLMDSPIVEQAPYNPKNGISKSMSPKDDAINCPNKSPANIYLMSLVVRPDFFKKHP